LFDRRSTPHIAPGEPWSFGYDERLRVDTSAVDDDSYRRNAGAYFNYCAGGFLFTRPWLAINNTRLIDGALGPFSALTFPAPVEHASRPAETAFIRHKTLGKPTIDAHTTSVDGNSASANREKIVPKRHDAV